MVEGVHGSVHLHGSPLKVHDHINDRRTLTRMNRDQLPSSEDSNFLDLNADTIY